MAELDLGECRSQEDREPIRIRASCLLCVAALGLPTCAILEGQEDVAKAIVEFKRTDPGITKFFATAYGYAVFPSVGKGAIGIGGARGKGYVYRRGRLIGRSTLTQLTVGFQLGGQAYREVIFFKDEMALDDFTRGNFEVSAQATAVALKAGASANLAYNGGGATVTIAKGGPLHPASDCAQTLSRPA